MSIVGKGGYNLKLDSLNTKSMNLPSNPDTLANEKRMIKVYSTKTKKIELTPLDTVRAWLKNPKILSFPDVEYSDIVDYIDSESITNCRKNIQIFSTKKGMIAQAPYSCGWLDACDDGTALCTPDSPPFNPDEWLANIGYEVNYDDDFIAIAFITPEQPNNCNGNAKILHIIKDSLNAYKNGDEFRIKRKKYCLGNTEFYRPIYILGNFKDGKAEFSSLDMDNFILTPKAAYSQGRDYFGLMDNFDDLLPDCRTDNSKKYDCFVHGNMVWLHAFYTPYFNPAKESFPYLDTLLKEVDIFFSNMGRSEKDKKAFFNRLSKNRDSIKVIPVLEKFAALGTIRGMREVGSGDSSYCDIRIVPNFIFRDGYEREANIKANGWGWKYRERKGQFIYEIRGKKMGKCFPAINAFQLNYIFGSFKNDYKDLDLVIDKVVSPWDFFYHKGNLVDLRMGLSYGELLSYFMPPGLTFKDAYLSNTGKMFGDELHSLTPWQQKEIKAAMEKVKKFCKEKPEDC